MSPGRRPNAGSAKERLVLDPVERKAALLGVIGAAKRRLILSLFRCDDFSVLDALAAALERGCEVEAVLTKRAKGGKKRLKKLWGALEEMGAVVTRYADPVVKYHANTTPSIWSPTTRSRSSRRSTQRGSVSREPGMRC
jgi:hypothetical protein